MKKIEKYKLLPNPHEFTLRITRKYLPQFSPRLDLYPRNLWDAKILQHREVQNLLNVILEKWLYVREPE